MQSPADIIQHILKALLKHLLFIYLIFSYSYAELKFPEDGSVVNSIYVLFEWEPILNSYYYEVQISTDSLFSNIIVNEIDSTYIYIEKEHLEWDTNYYWKINSFDSGSNLLNSEDNYAFTIGKKKYTAIINQNGSENNDLVVISTWGSEFGSVIFDRSGAEIWNSGNDSFMMYSIDKNGYLLGGKKYDNSNLWITGVQYDFLNGVIWKQEDTSPINHDMIQLGNGKIIGIQGGYVKSLPIPLGRWTDEFRNLGFFADGITNEFNWGAGRIVELDKEFESETIIWNPFDYYYIEDFDSLGSTWENAIINNQYDWLHSNSISYYNGYLYISQRHLSRVSKVKYPEGNLIWNMGIEETHKDTSIKNICSEIGFTWQHDVKILENGNMLMLDNGNLSKLIRNTPIQESRLLEFEVVNDDSCIIHWEYNINDSLYAHAMGSVQKLDNQNYLFSTIAGEGIGQILEVTKDEEIVWHASLYTNSSENKEYNIYRTYSIPGLFPNAFSIISKSPDIMDSTNTQIQLEIYNEGDYNQYYEYDIIVEKLATSIYKINLSIEPQNFPESKKYFQYYYLDSLKQEETISNENGSFLIERGKSYSFLKPLVFKAQTQLKNIKIRSLFPNPLYQDNIKIILSILDRSNIEIELIDIHGRFIKNVFSGYKNGGSHELIFSTLHLSSGIYFINIKFDDELISKKFIKIN